MAEFGKELTKSDIQQKLTVPTDFMRFHRLVNGQELDVIDIANGRSYKFILSTRRENYEKPVFQSRGWLDFVRQNHLQVGDEILFRKEDDDKFGIRVTRNFFLRHGQPSS